MEISLKDKVVVITGGSSGIGKSIAGSMRECSAQTIVIDLTIPSEKMERVTYYACDVSDGLEVRRTIQQIIEAFGTIDVLVNNAGINKPRLLVDIYGKDSNYVLTEEVYDQIVGVNQKGVFLCSQAAAEVMVKKRSGVIINISSESGMEGSLGQSCYAATKGAVNSFTLSWAKELGPSNIRVVGVAPGINEKTGMTSPELYEAFAYTRNVPIEQLDTGYEKAIPLGRLGKLSEIGQLTAFLASDLASYITGTTINISGGKSRG